MDRSPNPEIGALHEGNCDDDPDGFLYPVFEDPTAPYFQA